MTTLLCFANIFQTLVNNGGFWQSLPNVFLKGEINPGAPHRWHCGVSHRCLNRSRIMTHFPVIVKRFSWSCLHLDRVTILLEIASASTWQGPLTDTSQINKWVSLYYFPPPSWMWVAELSWHHQKLHPSPTFSCFLLPQIGDSLRLKLSDLLLSAQGTGSATSESSKHFKKYTRHVTDITCIWADILIWRWKREREKKKELWGCLSLVMTAAKLVFQRT